MNNDLKIKVENCSRTAEDFTRLYYASFDNRRHQIGRLYVDNAVFAWCGNGARGREMIERYFIELPSSSHHLVTLDAQPILAVPNQLSNFIITSGTVKYGDQPIRNFQQSFVITADGDKWKIVSDTYRLQECPTS